MRGRNMGLWPAAGASALGYVSHVQKTWLQILLSHLVSCDHGPQVSTIISEPQFLHLQDRGKNSTFLMAFVNWIQ